MAEFDEYATKEWALLISFFRWYPDIMEDLCEGPDCEFHNSIMSRVTKRYQARFAVTFTYACRGFGKTTMSIASACVAGILWPGEVTAYHAPSLRQAAPLAAKAFATFSRNYPLLAEHWSLKSDSRDNFRVDTAHGSSIRMNVERGMDTSCVIAEECAQEDRNPFDWDDFGQVVLGTNRLRYSVNGHPDPNHPDFREQYITSATGRGNPAYAVYGRVRSEMNRGGSAFALCIPWQVVVLSRMKPLKYYENLRRSLTEEQFARECMSVCSGGAGSPLIPPRTLENARRIMTAEDRIPSADPGGASRPGGTGPGRNAAGAGQPPGPGSGCPAYVIGYDVSYRQGNGNALCAVAVIRCDPDPRQPGEYIKSLVYVNDFPPPASAAEQARQIKSFWARYRAPGGPWPTLCVDANSYGYSVAEQLHLDTGDGLPPLSSITRDRSLVPLEKPDAVRCLYPMRASGPAGGRDTNPDMIEYVAREMENGRFLLLTSDAEEGLYRTKLRCGITGTECDGALRLPFIKTDELCAQIGNLRRFYGTSGWTEKEVSGAVRKDMWSAVIYAARMVWYMERENHLAAARDFSDDPGGDDGFFPVTTSPRRHAVRRLGRGAVG